VRLDSLYGIFPDDHYSDLIKSNDNFFSQDSNSREHLLSVIDSINGGYMLCFTNRCGSNYLSKLLASDNYYNFAGENLNYDVVFDAGYTLKNIYQYLIFLFRATLSAHNQFSIKLSVGQFVLLKNLDLLSPLLKKLKVIHIYREDIVAQAVSHDIALQTNQWMSTQSAIKTDLDYRPTSIVNIASRIIFENSTLLFLFKLFEVNYFSLSYENLLRAQEVVLKDLSDFLGHATQINYDMVDLKKQSSEVNDDFVKRFYLDVNAPGGGLGA